MIARRSINCIAACVVEGMQITKNFSMSAGRDEEDVDTMARVIKRARQLLCFENGLTDDEDVLVEFVKFQ